MVGTGEYTTGYVHDQASQSDKSAGVVALTLFDLRRQGRVGSLTMAGTNGQKFPGIRRHLQRVVGRLYKGLDIRFDSFPDDGVARDPQAYQRAMDRLSPGDVVTLFTPDDTHFGIGMEAVERGLHVLIAKPIVKTVQEHLKLARAATEHGVLVAMEVHKRWDPIYVDARDRIRNLGPFGYFSSYMSQPKSQLDTFRGWAGQSSDISYYLNAHHVDFHLWAVQSRARPRTVAALASTGVAQQRGIDTEDTITLCSQWENVDSGHAATAVYTASWIAPPSDVHSQQRFFYMGQRGEVQVDQAHRGYSVATDDAGFGSPNPLFMKYTPDVQGRFAGQTGYGYRSIEAFVDAVHAIRSRGASPADLDGTLATVHDTVAVTAILEAGRRSLDRGGRAISIDYDQSGRVQGLSDTR
jgi:D-galacturonate reductase